VLDFEGDVLDSRTGAVSARFRNPDPLNHHLNQAAFADVVAARLGDLGFA